MSSIRVITHMENKSFFCLTTTNQEWVLLIEVISREREKCLIYIIFKRLDIKPAWIELIQNIKSKTKK